MAVPEFAVNLKKLAKKYKRIKNDLQDLTTLLKDNPQAGIALQNNCYKIRVSNSSIPTGKSGGFRIVYYFLDHEKNIYLLSIYSKTQLETISENKILEILKQNNLS